MTESVNDKLRRTFLIDVIEENNFEDKVEQFLGTDWRNAPLSDLWDFCEDWGLVMVYTD